MMVFLPNLLVLALAVSTATAYSVGQTVKTSSGQISGHASAWQGEVSEYLGIPFAKPPVKDLRFAPPEPFRSSGAVNATKFGPSCPANVGTAPYSNSSIDYSSPLTAIMGVQSQFGDVFDEDCLTLNVWTKPQSGEKAKAVMLWVYGGGFNSGNTASPAYNGARLANEMDVIVVSVNYRVNLFGFPPAPFLPSMNVGLLDIRLAIEWVRDNIAAFSGDPTRITLFGQSAGAGAVDGYAYSWPDDPIVHAFIPESGTVAIGSHEGDVEGWYKVSEKVGCGGKDKGEETLSCMRAKTWQELLPPQKADPTAPGSRIRYGPIADGKLIFSDYQALNREGRFAKRPLLVGNTNNENGLGTPGKGNVTIQRPLTSYNLTTRAPLSITIACGTQFAAAARAAHGVPVWRYLYEGDYPNQNLGGWGAWHGSEIAMVFGTAELVSRMPDTENERTMSHVMMVAWTEFAKDPVEGWKRMNWPSYDPEKETVVKIGGKDSSKVEFVGRGVNDDSCPKDGLEGFLLPTGS
ncbi:alpha/beta-hydrolase [Aulographum hederae CBS 113979]|uniref:Alpha/beta-hydrolase n=1 Tax=Aulographum hederae CBS 113979 TaxID=1176131 RepID=A0A6G1GPT3_9PEZI|nr:alpha/beta-hydrolase [Aulographum hederae CBS 113979]